MLLRIKLFCDTPEKQTKGLMYASPLNRDECAFFKFSYSDEKSFWNKNVNFPISLLFLDDNFIVRNIGRLGAHQETPCRSNYPLTRYVIEGHEELINENIKIGDCCLIEHDFIKVIKGDGNINKKV